MYAEVVFDIPLSQRFTYAIPRHFDGVVQRGARVFVPFGRRKTTGYVIQLTENPPGNFKIKDISDVLDIRPMLNEEILRLSEWIADYYICGLGEVLRAALPGGLILESKKVVRLKQVPTPSELQTLQSRAPLQYKIISILQKAERLRVDTLRKRLQGVGVHYSLQRLAEAGFVELHDQVMGRMSHEKKIRFLKFTANAKELAKDLPQSAVRMQKIIDVLHLAGGSGRCSEILKEAQASTSSLRSLTQLGIIEVYERRVERDYYGDLVVPPAPKLVLNQDQENAVNLIQKALHAKNSKPFLIHGITSSGKTQVYIEVVRETLVNARDAIILVPEIALTPQIVQRFRSEFQDQVAVLHSRMSHGERYDAWCKIKEGRARVVVGPRSAIFAPVKNLGLIVVDEEQENSYKQTDQSPRYHARDVAVVRGKLANAVVILGSATPSMESYHNIRLGKYTLVEMRNRIDEIPLPEVKLVNLAREKRWVAKGHEVILSRPLVDKIQEKLARKEQIIILQNRRGFSTSVLCDECGYVQMCPNCNISMSYHLQGLRMRCHYCNEMQKAPEFCPNCKSIEIRYRGVGTQKVEKIFQETFPRARIVRMDMDTTRGRRSHDKILQDFAEYKYDILIGTQMIAKGLDFSKVTLVGVISADTGLYLPDFRASERTFQLLTQVAGRAGRKEKQGEVVIQTFSPDHICLQCAKDHDFKRFFYSEMQDRRQLHYPPFGRIALLQLRHEDEKKVQDAARHLALILNEKNNSFQVLGPSPAPLSRLQKFYRYQIILKNDRNQDPSAALMRQSIRKSVNIYHEQTKLSRVKLTIDIDPVVIL